MERSLIRQADAHGGGEPRFTMLETIREFGLEQLEFHGEANDTRQRHADYFLALAEAAVPHLETSDETAWLDRLKAELDNLRAALRWAVSRGERERGLRLGGALWLFWFMRGRLTEGREWLEELLALADRETHRVARAKALAGAATLARYQGDHTAARLLAEQALAIHRELSDQQGIANALDTLGYLAFYREDFATAGTLYQEPLISFSRQTPPIKA
jgi:predicted ATPase